MALSGMAADRSRGTAPWFTRMFEGAEHPQRMGTNDFLPFFAGVTGGQKAPGLAACRPHAGGHRGRRTTRRTWRLLIRRPRSKANAYHWPRSKGPCSGSLTRNFPIRFIGLAEDSTDLTLLSLNTKCFIWGGLVRPRCWKYLAIRG